MSWFHPRDSISIYLTITTAINFNISLNICVTSHDMRERYRYTPAYIEIYICINLEVFRATVVCHGSVVVSSQAGMNIYMNNDTWSLLNKCCMWWKEARKTGYLPTCLPFFFLLEIVRLAMMMMMMSRVRQHVYRFNIISAVKLTLWTVEHTLCTKLCSWAPHTHTHVITAAISRNRLCAEL